MTRLLLLRHAESEWNAQGRWQGLADPPLSPRGELQAASAGRLLRRFGISAVVSSDLRRAEATAARVAAALLLPAPLLDPGLREYDVGAWSGLTRPEIEARWPGAVDGWRQGQLAQTPGGERREVFIDRITTAVTRVARATPAATVLVVTHGGLINALARSLGAEPSRVAHLAGRWVDAGPLGLLVGPAISLLDDTPGPEAADTDGELSSTVLDTGGR